MMQVNFIMIYIIYEVSVLLKTTLLKEHNRLLFIKKNNLNIFIANKLFYSNNEENLKT